jgi:hypothetical protein
MPVDAFVRFEENKGQVAADVDFMARLSGATLFLHEGHAVFVPASARQSRSTGQPDALRLEFVGAEARATGAGEGELPSRSHYLIGRDPSRWQTDVRHVERVRYRDVYPGIDVLYRGGHTLEFDVIVQPGADASSVRFQLTGADRVEQDVDGRLVATLASEEVILDAPHAYQEIDGVRRAVEGRFALAGGEVSFEIGRYSRSIRSSFTRAMRAARARRPPRASPSTVRG